MASRALHLDGRRWAGISVPDPCLTITHGMASNPPPTRQKFLSMSLDRPVSKSAGSFTVVSSTVASIVHRHRRLLILDMGSAHVPEHLLHRLDLASLRGGDGPGELLDGRVVRLLEDRLGHRYRGSVVLDHEPEKARPLGEKVMGWTISRVMAGSSWPYLYPRCPIRLRYLSTALSYAPLRSGLTFSRVSWVGFTIAIQHIHP